MQISLEQNEFKRVLQIAELLPNTIKLLVRHINSMKEEERVLLLQRLRKEMHEKESADFFKETGLNLEEVEERLAAINSKDRKEQYERTVNIDTFPKI